MSDEKTKITTDLTSSKVFNHDFDVLIVIGGHLNGAMFELSREVTTAGRNEDCDITLNAPGVSRLHFSLRQVGKTLELTDLGSSNGTFLNEKKVEKPEKVKSGDVIKVGHIALKYLARNSAEIAAHKKLIDQATKDGLTGCYNKKYLFDILGPVLERTFKGSGTLCLIVIDIDHFKKLNDNQGHDAGDAVLKEMALLIREKHVREKDVFARFGGEEFVLLLPETSLQLASQLAERMRSDIEKHKFHYGDQVLNITVSIGISHTHTTRRTHPQELFIQADKALYLSKEGGRNKVSYFEEE